MTEILYWRPDGVPDLARATPGSSGYDLAAYLPGSDGVEVKPGKLRVYPCGLHLAMPYGVEAQIRRRSGLAVRHGIVTDLGTVDADFRGHVSALLFNLGEADFVVRHGDRIAQLVFAPVLLPTHAPGGTATGIAWSREAWLHHEFPLLLPQVQAHQTFWLRRVAALSDLPSSDRGDGGWGSTGVQS